MDLFDYSRKVSDRANQSRRNRERFEPPTITSVGDIQRVLAQLDPKSRLNQSVGDVLLSADVRGSDSESTRTFNVRAKSEEQSYRDIIMRSMQLLRQRREAKNTPVKQVEPLVVDDKEMLPPAVLGDDGVLAVDPIISRLLGAYREGELICWDLDDGYTYRYDIFAHRLTRVSRDAETTDD